MSRKMLDHFLVTDETTLAQERYRYLEMRADLGSPQVWDRPVRELWVKLGGRIRRPRTTDHSQTRDNGDTNPSIRPTPQP